MHDSERSSEALTEHDLQHLIRIVPDRLGKVFDRPPVAGMYRERLVVLALCQGAAQHNIDGRNGIKDLDVRAFFREGPTKPFPARTIWHADFGVSHLGRNPRDTWYVGQRIDIMGWSISFGLREPAETTIQK